MDAVNSGGPARQSNVVVVRDEIERGRRIGREIALEKWQKPIDDLVVGDDRHPMVFRRGSGILHFALEFNFVSGPSPGAGIAGSDGKSSSSYRGALLFL